MVNPKVDHMNKTQKQISCIPHDSTFSDVSKENYEFVSNNVTENKELA